MERATPQTKHNKRTKSIDPLLTSEIDEVTEKVEDSKLSTTDIVKEDKNLTITNLDVDTTENIEDTNNVLTMPYT